MPSPRRQRPPSGCWYPAKLVCFASGPANKNRHVSQYAVPSSMFIGMVYRKRISFHTERVRKSSSDTGPYNRSVCSVRGGVE